MIFLLRNGSRKTEAVEIIIEFFSYFNKVNYQFELKCSVVLWQISRVLV